MTSSPRTKYDLNRTADALVVEDAADIVDTRDGLAIH